MQFAIFAGEKKRERILWGFWEGKGRIFFVCFGVINQFYLSGQVMSELGLDPKLIYSYDTHRNIPWNVMEYQPLRAYEDPLRAITQRKIQEGTANFQKYVTKKVGFLDQHLKNVKDLPPPSKYDSKSQFDQTLNRKQSKKHKIDLKLRKNSYLEQIERQAKRYKSPGVGSYKFDSTSHSKSTFKKGEKSQRHFFYQDSEFLSTAVPGSGCYYPRQEVPHVKKERKTYQDWIKKHGEENERDRKRKLKEPAPGSYVPLHASFSSFDKIKHDIEKHKQKVGKKKPLNGFGSSDSKFPYERTKKGSKEARPDPGHYNTAINWQGKGQDTKQKGWSRCLSAGPTRSIYQ